MLWPGCPASLAAWVEPQDREQNLAAVLDAASCCLGRQKGKTGSSTTTTFGSFMGCKDRLRIDGGCLVLTKKYNLQGLV